MILSHVHRFIFIKGVKVAGTSAEISLSQVCGPEDIVTPISPADERYRLGTPGQPRNYSANSVSEQAYVRAIAEDPLVTVQLPKSQFYNHMPLTQVLERVPEAADYRLLFVERSPYEKVLSFANWSEHRRLYDAGASLPKTPTGIEAVVDRLIEDGSITTVRNIGRYRDASGAIVSRGWRCETLADELHSFFTELGVDAPRLVHAKRGFDSGNLHPGEVLRRDQIGFINEAFAEEFETFGYPML